MPQAPKGDEALAVLLRIVVNAAALWLAATIVPGIEVTGPAPLVAAALVLGLINAFVRPILVVLTFPLTLVTLGLFLLVLNAICLWLTAGLVPGFAINGFIPAFIGALLISAVSWVLHAFVQRTDRVLRA